MPRYVEDDILSVCLTGVVCLVASDVIFCCLFVVESADTILEEEGVLTGEEDLDHLGEG